MARYDLFKLAHAGAISAGLTFASASVPAVAAPSDVSGLHYTPLSGDDRINRDFQRDYATYRADQDQSYVPGNNFGGQQPHFHQPPNELSININNEGVSVGVKALGAKTDGRNILEAGRRVGNFLGLNGPGN